MAAADGSGRRRFLRAAGIAAAAFGSRSHAATRVDPPPQGAPPLNAPTPAEFPALEYVYGAVVSIGELETVGNVVAGEQRVIPITGGTFAGPRLRGTIVPGAVDWNLKRGDGMTVVSAAYFLRTDDGVLIRIVNQGVNPQVAPGKRPARPRFTTPVFEAPQGRYEWLNQAVFVGTLEPGEPTTVRIRVFKLV